MSTENTDAQASGDVAESAEPQTFNGLELMASLTVNDLEKSMAWYCDVLGFVVDRKHEREGKLIATSLKAGNVQILLNQDNGAQGWDRAKGVGLSFQITTNQSIDEIADRIKQMGGTLVTEPTDMPWGARMFRIQDPDGFKFTIATPR
jgi:uncharacterized glyoxalase superfamily protein PhnB